MHIDELNQFFDALEEADSTRWKLKQQLREVYRLARNMKWPERVKVIDGRGFRIDGWEYEIDVEGIITDDTFLPPEDFMQHICDASNGEFEEVFEEFFGNIGITE